MAVCWQWCLTTRGPKKPLKGSKMMLNSWFDSAQPCRLPEPGQCENAEVFRWRNVGKCFLSATGYYHQQISSSHELICQVRLGILTCLLLLPWWLIAAMRVCPGFQQKGDRFLMPPQLKAKPMHLICLGMGLARKRKTWIPPGTSWFHAVPARTGIPRNVTHLIINTWWQMRRPRSAGLFL